MKKNRQGKKQYLVKTMNLRICLQFDGEKLGRKKKLAMESQYNNFTPMEPLF